jgi:hypothetical protein
MARGLSFYLLCSTDTDKSLSVFFTDTYLQYCDLQYCSAEDASGTVPELLPFGNCLEQFQRRPLQSSTADHSTADHSTADRNSNP